jgi:hypothetical protein
LNQPPKGKHPPSINQSINQRMGSASFDEFDDDFDDLLLDDNLFQLIDQQSQQAYQNTPQIPTKQSPVQSQEITALNTALQQSRGENTIVRSKLDSTLAENTRLNATLLNQQRSSLSTEKSTIDGYTMLLISRLKSEIASLQTKLQFNQAHQKNLEQSLLNRSTPKPPAKMQRRSFGRTASIIPQPAEPSQQSLKSQSSGSGGPMDVSPEIVSGKSVETRNISVQVDTPVVVARPQPHIPVVITPHVALPPPPSKPKDDLV